MDYKVKVINRNDRQVRIEQEVAEQKKKEAAKTYPFTFRNNAVDLPVIRLPLEFLIYRMDNGRTGLRQAEFTHKHKLAEDYFLKAEEDAQAQQIQHAILLELAHDPRGPIYDELKYRCFQTEELLITDTGVVVNGNRRLAAMRQLLLDEPKSCSSYSHVNVAVLPGEANREDIEEIESELQEIPETKLEYDWLSRRMKMRYRRDVLKFSPEKLVKIYRFKSKDQINKELQQLQLAEEYLERYLKKPREYEFVEIGEEIFKQLQVSLENKTPEMQEMSRLIAFPLIKEARSLGNRAYEFRYAFGNDAAELLERVATEEKIELGPLQYSDHDDTESTESDDDPLSDISDKAGDRYKKLKPLLLDMSKSEIVAKKLVALSNAIRQERKDGGRKMLALRNAETANRVVHEIDLSIADPSTFPTVSAQLRACITKAQQIIDQIKKQEDSK